MLDMNCHICGGPVVASDGETFALEIVLEAGVRVEQAWTCPKCAPKLQPIEGEARKLDDTPALPPPANEDR